MTAPTWALELAKEKTTCPRCEAKPSEDCKTMGGNESGVHAARTDPLVEAYEQGRKSGTEGNSSLYEEGMPAPRDYAKTGETEPQALVEPNEGLLQPGPSDPDPIGHTYV